MEIKLSGELVAVYSGNRENLGTVDKIYLILLKNFTSIYNHSNRIIDFLETKPTLLLQ